MAHRFLKLSLVCMAIIASTDLKAQQAPVLWYDSPAEYWEEALPLGNGRLGAMVYGNPVNEEIQLNEETISAGAPYKNYNPETYTLYSYAAVQALKQGIEKAKSTDPVAVAKALHENGPFQTVVGDLSFDAKGDVTRADYVVYEWRKGPDGKISYFQIDK